MSMAHRGNSSLPVPVSRCWLRCGPRQHSCSPTRTVPTNTWIGDGSELTSHNKRLGVVDADSEGEMYVDG
jgi:hypothetical protein